MLIPAASENPDEIPIAILIGAKTAATPAPPAPAAPASARPAAPPPLTPTAAPRPAPTPQPVAAVPKLTPAAAPLAEKAATPAPPAKSPAPTITAPPATAASAAKVKVAIPTPAAAPALPAEQHAAATPETAKPPAPAVKPSAPSVPPSTPAPAAGAAPAEDRSKVQVAALTPTLKRDIVRAVRERLADEAKWMPRKTEDGKFAYAAKVVGGRLAPVPITSPDATHFSLLGAVLLEFHQRNVTQTASGRKEFLDGEIVEAIRQVTGRPGTTAAAEASPTGRAADPMAMTHAQCLQALDLLDQRYSRKAEATTPPTAERKREPARLADILRKIEKQEAITAEEVATAVRFELEEVNRRLAQLERGAS